MKKSLGAKTLLYPTPVLIVGTYDSRRQANAATVAWGGICCSKPVCVSISLRAATFTHSSILEKKCFTVNIPSEKYVTEADFFGIASGRNTDKPGATGLTTEKAGLIDAPVISEFPLNLECRLTAVHELGLHTQFIGEVLDVRIDEDCLDSDGKPDIKKIAPFIYSPGDRNYYGISNLIANAFSAGKKFQ
jgi:flavin reductase (DIM6/NTAB) family NADH-FMN oxidoreductase RutF